ncbi:MAG: response regulator [Chitinophagaceae bacterium]|nr:response regulator [Chitinophagaceae bacterium]
MIIPQRIVSLVIWLGLVWALLPVSGMGQYSPAKKFSQLTTLDGLSQSTVNCILKDKFGFLWFGTQDGLNRYDGYSFTIYRNRPGVVRSLPDNQIKCLVEDPGGNLWVGTKGGGLCYYDRDQDAFLRPEDLGFQSDKPIDLAVLSLHLDKKGQLWIGTFHDLWLMGLKNKTIRHFIAGTDAHTGLSDPTIQSIFEDSRDRLWIGTDRGLNLFNDSNGTFTHFLHDDKDVRSLSNNKVIAITEDAHHRLWVGTNGGGLNRMDELRGGFTCYKKGNTADGLSGDVVRSLYPAEGGGLWIGTEDALDLLQDEQGPILHYRKGETSEGNLSDKTILSLLQDSSGILWVGTSEGGVNKYDKNIFYFDLHRRTANPNSLSADMVTSFAEADNGDIWIGTDGDGLHRWEKSSGRLIHYPSGAGGERSLGAPTVLSLLMNKKKDCLWIGTYGNGLGRLDLRNGIFHHYRTGSGPGELSNASIYALMEDRTGNIWMATNGGGVNILDPSTGRITKHRYADNEDSISNDYIRCFLEDRAGNIWIGTYSGGISVYDPHTRKFKIYNKVRNNLSNQVVYALYKDANDNIWVGTMGGGLNLLDPKQRRFISFTEENGLSNNIIHSIMGDEKGHLWLSTNKGISRFDPATREFRNYGIYNGLQNPEFIVGSGYKTRDGRILFGGVNGFNVFDPGRIPENKISPPICRFTGFFLFNKLVAPGGPHSVLARDINNTTSITLAYDQSDFTIGYAALNYTLPAGNRYTYMLEGFDKTWINAGDERRATYTNLAPGTYRFLVKASNNDGIWNDTATTLVIHINPPFWKTWWAWLLYIIVTGGVLYVIYKDIVGKEKLKAQMRLQQLTADQARELSRIKLNFFTNVSHELRTPLSLIMDPLRKIIREKMTIEQVKQYSGLMYDNARRLMKLIDQMLDLRKLEEGHLRLETKLVNIAAVTRNIAGLFDVHAEERNIHYSIDAASEPATLIDQDKFEKIVFNLLSNAFKYTPDNGRIEVLVTTEKEFAVIHVKDTGVGIPAHLKDKVFEIFYQVEGSHRFESGSAGIGLALTKELVELHGGHIVVESQLGEGSDFIVYLPLDSRQPSPETGTENISEALYPLELSVPEAAVDPVEQAPLVLLVEDNKDLRNYLKQELGRSYKVEDASDGTAGYEKAVQWVPDLIISDIMMPGITGLELCRKIKTDERTSHIPVILLTAKQADVHQIEGYSVGADAYIPKPFNMELVLARVENLLDSRRRLRELYHKAQGQPSPGEDQQPVMNSMDRLFLDKATGLVEQNMGDILFDTDVLAENLKISRRQLYRKLKALTDQTVHDFITSIRMKKAADLLLTGDYNISEVAYKVGYSEPANFTRSFTRWSGKSPKKYISGYEGGQAS